MLVGAQALDEMPDLLTFVIMASAGIGVTVVWNLWIFASLLTMGRHVPAPLAVEAHAETYMGIITSFARTPGQGLACFIVFITFVLQFESSKPQNSCFRFLLSDRLLAAIMFTRFFTTRCVKKW